MPQLPYMTDATFSVTLTDSVGTPVTTATGTLEVRARDGTELLASAALAHQGSGVYTGDLPDTLTVTPGQKVWAFVDLDDGTYQVHLEVPMYVYLRES